MTDTARARATFDHALPMPRPATSDDDKWTALRARDPAARFFYSVKTTGVYCRPSCKARPARPENVAFHATTKDAERAGFRPCKRCRPDEPPRDERDAAWVAEVCRTLAARDDLPTSGALARELGVSPSHLERTFKAVLGMTPRAWVAAQRATRVRDALRDSKSVTDAIYDAGFSSSSRFYEASDRALGMTPTALRRGGRGLTLRHAFGRSSLGEVLVAATERGVSAILLGDGRDSLLADLATRFPEAKLVPADRGFRETVDAVIAFVERPEGPRGFPLDLLGTAFQARVWAALLRIPAGERTTYAALADALGSPRAVRAVARACATNAVAVAVPCHRVVRKDGDLAGYRWGLERKRTLLAREAQGKRR